MSTKDPAMDVEPAVDQEPPDEQTRESDRVPESSYAGEGVIIENRPRLVNPSTGAGLDLDRAIKEAYSLVRNDRKLRVETAHREIAAVLERVNCIMVVRQGEDGHPHPAVIPDDRL